MRDSTQQVLVALAGISGAVIVAAVLARVYPDRSERSLPVALFEAIVVGVIIISAMVTGESALVALFQHHELTSSTMSHIAWPLAFGVVLLIILAMASRFASTTRDPWMMVPIVVSVVYLAVAAGFALDLSLSSGQLWPFVTIVLGSSGLIALATWRLEVALNLRSEQSRREEVTARWQGDCAPAERELVVGIPGAVAMGLVVRCWVRDGRILLDGTGARRMQSRVDDRWQAVFDHQLDLPRSKAIITGVRVHTRWAPPWRDRLDVRLQRAGADRAERITVDARDGFFDITETGLV
jgi:hypothetical protein